MEVLKVKGDTTIRWYRGDTKTVSIFAAYACSDAEESTLRGMRVTFTARARFGGKKVLEKSAIVGDGSASLNFTHDETRALRPGQYTYDIELRKEDYSVVCTLYTGTLIIETDVTREDGA